VKADTDSKLETKKAESDEKSKEEPSKEEPKEIKEPTAVVSDEPKVEKA